MKTDPYHDRESINELLKQYNNLRNGSTSIFLDEESFEKIIDYFDDQEDLGKAREAADTAQAHPDALMGERQDPCCV